MRWIIRSTLLLLLAALGLAESAGTGAQSANEKPHFTLLCLMYHRFVAQGAFDRLSKEQQAYAITPERFEDHLRILAEAGRDVIALSDAIAFAKGERDLKRDSILLTIDDGCESALTIAAPILKKYGMTATLFVTTDPSAYVFGCDAGRCNDPRLGRKQIRAWCDMGFDIGSHGVTHRPLNSLPDSELMAELVVSKRKLESLAGREVAALAVPRGRWDDRVQRTARESGYEAVFTSKRGRVESGAGLFGLARWNVSGRWSDSKLRSVIGDRPVRAAVASRRSLPMPSPSSHGEPATARQNHARDD